jgi:hypothetical protein
MEERIQTKLAELAQQKEQAIANLNAILGAEQALRQLLEPDKKEATECKPSTSKCATAPTTFSTAGSAATTAW